MGVDFQGVEKFYPPKWMVKIMEKPMNKWMIWGGKNTPSFGNSHVSKSLIFGNTHVSKSINEMINSIPETNRQFAPENVPMVWTIHFLWGRFAYSQVSSVENPGWLFDIGDYTTQLYGDYNKPI